MNTPGPVPIANTPSPIPGFRFGAYELDMRIRLQEQPLLVLAALLNCPGELVTRDDLRSRVWPRDTFVSFDHALNTAVKKIRAALSDDADAPRYVETMPRRGYRFIAPVETIGSPVVVPVTEASGSKTAGFAPRTLWQRFFRLPVVAPVAAVLLLLSGVLYL